MKEVLSMFVMIAGFTLLIWACLSQSKKIELKRFYMTKVNFGRIDFLEREAKINGFDPDFGRAIIWVESRGNSDAISPTGPRGIAQITRANARYFGYQHEDMHNDEKAIQVMFRLLHEAREYYKKEKTLHKEDVKKYILREYNKGRSFATRNHLAGVSYARQVLYVYEAIKKGNSFVYIGGEKHKIDLSKINGEA